MLIVLMLNNIDINCVDINFDVGFEKCFFYENDFVNHFHRRKRFENVQCWVRVCYVPKLGWLTANVHGVAKKLSKPFSRQLIL